MLSGCEGFEELIAEDSSENIAGIELVPIALICAFVFINKTVVTCQSNNTDK